MLAGVFRGFPGDSAISERCGFGARFGSYLPAYPAPNQRLTRFFLRYTRARARDDQSFGACEPIPKRLRAAKRRHFANEREMRPFGER